MSAFESDYPRDFGFALTEQQMASPQLQQMVANPPDWVAEWTTQVGTDLATGLVEGPGWSALALSGGVVYHTLPDHAPDGSFLAPYYYQLLDQVPKGRGDVPRPAPRRVPTQLKRSGSAAPCARAQLVRSRAGHL